MTSMPVRDTVSFETNPDWLTAAIREHSRLFAVFTPVLVRTLHFQPFTALLVWGEEFFDRTMDDRTMNRRLCF